MKNIPEVELLASGHRACAGCGSILALRYALKALGKDVVISMATGCMEVTTTPYPQTSWRVPWIHAAFENAAAVASGVSRGLKVLGKKDVEAVAIAGDGGTADIGLQALSGAMERGEDLVYICYDNEAYENTGIQRSSLTPFGAWTTTTPVGKVNKGKDRPKKDLPAIIAAHGVPYVATASISHPLDYMKKLKKAREIKGPAYVHVIAPCPAGWRFEESKTIEIARLAVETGIWLLYEIEDGKLNVTLKPKRKPVADYLKLQGRFKHLAERDIAEIQRLVDEKCKRFGVE